MVVSSQEIKDLVAGKVPQGRGFIWWSACQAVKIEGGSPNFMRFGMSMHMMMGKRLVIVGGGFAGLECAGAMYKDREVTVIEESGKLGNGIGIIDRKPEINHLKQLGIRLLENTKVLEVTNQGIRVETTIYDRKTKEVVEVKQELIPCDTVLISVGVQENKKLYDEVVAAMPDTPVHLIGDATTPAGKVYRSLEATNAGYALGMQL
jgi:2,4-dienoyl-CoA reductase (NADPH2)